MAGNARITLPPTTTGEKYGRSRKKESMVVRSCGLALALLLKDLRPCMKTDALCPRYGNCSCRLQIASDLAMWLFNVCDVNVPEGRTIAQHDDFMSLKGL